MTIEDVKVIIQGDETRTLEMKKTTGELKDGSPTDRRRQIVSLIWQTP